MDILITDFVSKISFGETQSFKNLQIIPLFTEGRRRSGVFNLKGGLGEEIAGDYRGECAGFCTGIESGKQC